MNLFISSLFLSATIAASFAAPVLSLGLGDMFGNILSKPANVFHNAANEMAHMSPIKAAHELLHLTPAKAVDHIAHLADDPVLHIPGAEGLEHLPGAEGLEEHLPAAAAIAHESDANLTPEEVGAQVAKLPPKEAEAALAHMSPAEIEAYKHALLDEIKTA